MRGRQEPAVTTGYHGAIIILSGQSSAEGRQTLGRRVGSSLRSLLPFPGAAATGHHPRSRWVLCRDDDSTKIRKDEAVSCDDLTGLNRHRMAEHGAGIGEGVKLATFSTRVGTRR